MTTSQDSDNPLDATQGYTRELLSGYENSEHALPTRVGRYKVRGHLGRGGFANVLLAHDEQLDRQIALKLPRRDRFHGDQLRAFVEEARTAARLQHPGIVTVFDVGTEGDTPFIVLEYIRGRSLAHLLEHESLPLLAAAQLVAEIAEALAHAHEQGFVHRDIKPQNILLDVDDRPHIADFGLAVRHREQANVSDNVVGTTQYMSPEQVRGENHRIDGRTDLWALGVVFYRILTGRLPFTGSTAQEVFQKILYTEPEPLRQFEAAIPSELERICLRCLCQQMSSRYRTANELVDELGEWIQFTTGGSGSSLRRRSNHIEPPDTPVIPRGLRSFAEEDRDFFLKLIPGPRDRDGLPTPVRFWKTRIEEREADETFAVGILYGPSGCGKSSLIKAGVIPRLTPDITAIYVDVTPAGTEERILRRLRKRFKGLSREVDLADSLRELRESSDLRAGQKLVLVLDQFEQWLHRWQTGANAELVRALLQCDGGNVQCVLMVRDDFWLPVSRFMRQLELGIVDGTNAMLVDSFDPDHARSVLREFGVAFNRLPEDVGQQTAEQTAFVNQAITDLTEDNRLYPVRLAVFVEMVKDREWVVSTLEEMGGTEGVGVAFLENSLGSRARPARRVHEQAARGVLAALLPQVGQIKDAARTRTELLAASKCGSNLKDFDDLIRLLDVDLRLLTPAQSATEETRNNASDNTSENPSVSEPVYQLTHDFLVPSIREWLDCQLRGSRRGRARLLLQEQAELWNNRPSPRFLPSVLEWIGLRLQTDRREWTLPQLKMMQAASRRLVQQLGIVICVIVLCSSAASVFLRQLTRHRMADEAAVLVSKLVDVGIDDVPNVVDEMAGYREWLDPLLDAKMIDESLPNRVRIRAAIATLPVKDAYASWLMNQLASVQLSPRDFLVILNSLANHREGMAATLHQLITDESQSPRSRFRIACALAAFDQSQATWDGLGPEVVTSLLLEQGAYSTIWIEALKPVGEQLRQPILSALAEAETLESARTGALALYEFDNHQTGLLVDALTVGEAPQYRAIVDQLFAHDDPAEALLAIHAKLARLNEQIATVSDPDTHAEHQANLILASYELGEDALLSEAAELDSDPRLRTRLVLAMHPDRIDLFTFLPLITDQKRNHRLRAIALLAACQHNRIALSDESRRQLITSLLAIYRTVPESESHSAAERLLRKLEVDLTEAEQGVGELAYDSNRDWFVNKARQTMVVLHPPSLQLEGYVPPSELDYTFAISATEVRLDSYQEFLPSHFQDKTYQIDERGVPVAGMLAFRTAQYCNWLSRNDGIPESEWCYPPESQVTSKACEPVQGFELKTGYRLPLSVEWEYACRAGSTTSRFFGEDARLLRHYGWHKQNSDGLIYPVAQLLPNAFGLFDTYGNVTELCLADRTGKKYVVRGESSFRTAEQIASSSAEPWNPQAFSRRQGFRVVRRLD